MIGEQTVASTRVGTLTAIWERALQRSPIAIHDNFFDLGGYPASANRLFSEIAQEYGRDLSPLTIYQAPTIAELASVLEKPEPPRLKPCVRLKAGNQSPPIFLVPGLGGSVMEFFQLVSHIESRHPVFGMQSRGMDGVDKPFERIEDLAQFFLDAIGRLQPIGPYILIGYSLGGLVTLEMARRLSEKGENVALLAMVESYPHATQLPFGQHADIVVRRAQRFVSKIFRRAGFPSRISSDGEESMLDKPRMSEKWAVTMERVRRSAYLSWQRYRPRHYSGKITFVRATEIDPLFPRDPNAVWARLADEFVVDTIPGGHFGGLGANSKSLAAALSRYLQETRLTK
jgi:acetoacetyl-CoA synthetase